MPTTDDELAQKREQVEKLRASLAESDAQRTERENLLANDITAAQLDAEAARLEAELVRSKDAAKASNVKEAALPLQAAQADAKAAEAALKATQQSLAKASTNDTDKEA